MKKECEIIRDLLPSYIENLVSEQTKKYVSEHIENCSECEKVLHDMQRNTIIENENYVNAQQAEIKIIKKQKRKDIALKLIVTTIIFILIALIAIISVFYIKYMPNYSIVSKARNKLESLDKLDNYKVTIEERHLYYDTQKEDIIFTTYYYKDGTFKEEKEGYGFPTKSTNYGDKSSYRIVRNIFDRYCGDIPYYARDMQAIADLNITENIYDGKECYVLKETNSPDDHEMEIWIDKETMIEIREIQTIPSSSYCYERNVKVEENVVTDEDVMPKNMEE